MSPTTIAHLPCEPLGNRLFLIVAVAPQSGKTTVASHLSRRFGVPHVMSSSVINAPVEARLGLPAGTIAAARRVDVEAYRPELIAEADRMRAEAVSPGLLCVRNGARIIDGLRAGSEVREAAAEARLRGLRPLVICLERPGRKPHDNTDVAGLRAAADIIIRNPGPLEALYAAVDAAVDLRIAA